MTAPKTYEIRTVEDLLEVPSEKLAACMVDLEAWARIMREIRELGPELVRQIDKPGACGPGRFVWIDDGEHNANISVRVVTE